MTALGYYLAVSTKVEIAIPYDEGIPLLNLYLPETHICVLKAMFETIHRSIIDNSSKSEITQISVNSRIYK